MHTGTVQRVGPMADTVEVRGAIEDTLDARCERWRKRSIFSSMNATEGQIIQQPVDASSSSDESDDDPSRGAVSESPPTPPPLPPLPPPSTSPSSIGINGTCPCLPDPDALGQVRRPLWFEMDGSLPSPRPTELFFLFLSIYTRMRRPSHLTHPSRLSSSSCSSLHRALLRPR